MGIKLGIDIGTTNTVVSTFRNGKPEALKHFYDFFGEKKDAIIPSVQLYMDSEKFFGTEAVREFERIYQHEKEKLGGISLHYEYKMEMDKQGSQAIELTRSMVDFILDTITKNEKVAIDGIVVTVPHEWEPGTRGRFHTELAIRSNIHKIPLLQIVSEPIAAAAYYAFVRKSHKQETVLVCDLGGGTQDYTLCRISPNNSFTRRRRLKMFLFVTRTCNFPIPKFWKLLVKLLIK
ncbi:MAG: Hsp70 family protein [Leptospiraceae bacterium]|nr:Hsp70 family protein [Leptospiraceae bacterium]